MIAQTSDPSEASHRHAQHRRAHRAALVLIAGATLAVCAAGFPPLEPAPDRAVTLLAIGLGLACIVLRRLSTSPMIEPTAELWLGTCGLVCGVALAVLGCLLAWQAGAARTGIAYAAGAFILCARPPIDPSRRVRRRPLTPK